MIRGVSEKYQTINSNSWSRDYDVITVKNGNILETIRHTNAKLGEQVTINKIFVFEIIFFWQFFWKIFWKIFWFFFEIFSDFFKISVFSLKRLEIYRNLLQWKIFCEKVKFEKFPLRGLYRHLENFRKNSKFYFFGLNWSEICRNLFSWKNFAKE